MDTGGLWLIRHAESTWNAARRWQGQGNPPLSARGRNQARALAGELAAARIEVLISSDLDRARETAETLAARWRIEVHLESGFQERDLGCWSGLTEQQIVVGWPDVRARFAAQDEGLRPGGGERLAELRRRVAAALERLVGLAERRVGIVTHLGVIRLLEPGAAPANASWCKTSLDVCRKRLGGCRASGARGTREGGRCGSGSIDTEPLREEGA